MKNTLKSFNTSLSKLRIEQKSGNRIMQNHFGDFLIIEEEQDNDKYRVWLNHENNVKEGESRYTIEFYGKSNGYVWKTIKKG